jgi:hypothetical protein
MKAYEFTTKINQGKVVIPDQYLRELTTNENIRVILLTQEENNQKSAQIPHSKLSELLLLPELEEAEDLFIRNQDLGRDIIL